MNRLLLLITIIFIPYSSYSSEVKVCETAWLTKNIKGYINNDCFIELAENLDTVLEKMENHLNNGNTQILELVPYIKKYTDGSNTTSLMMILENAIEIDLSSFETFLLNNKEYIKSIPAIIGSNATVYQTNDSLCNRHKKQQKIVGAYSFKSKEIESLFIKSLRDDSEYIKEYNICK